MQKLLLTVIFQIVFTLLLLAQDTIVIQTLTFDSTGRRGIYQFPEEGTFRKILMHHTLICPCAEWDYLTYNQIHKHTGIWDSTLYYHPDFTYINGMGSDSILIKNTPNHRYERYIHKSVIFNDTVSLENWMSGDGNTISNSVLSAEEYAGRSQFIWRAEELLAQGMTPGPVTGIKLNILVPSAGIEHLRIRIDSTALDVLTPDTLLLPVHSVYFNSFEQQWQGWFNFNFDSAFYWNGISNIIIEFSTTVTNTGDNIQIAADETGWNAGISSSQTNYALDLDGEMDFVDLPDSVYFNSNFTFQAWIKKRSNNNWSRLFDFGNGPNKNNVLIALTGGTNGKLSFHIYNDNSNKSFEMPYPSPIDEWFHLTLKLTNNIAWVYINGEFMKYGPLQIPQDILRTRNFIGKSNWDGDGYANMLMDEFRIYNRPLEADEIRQNYLHELTEPLTDTSLIVYYTFNEGSGNLVHDHSMYGLDGTCYGLPEWHRTRGDEVMLDFIQDNLRPQIKFERLISQDIAYDSVYITETIEKSPVQIVLFEDVQNPTVPTDTILEWRAGYEFVYENGIKSDSVWLEPDEIIYKHDLPYYGEPFELIDDYEIGRYITPYGNGLSLGSGFTWTFDITDYEPLLHGMVDLSAGNWQEQIDLKFEFIKGTPPRDVMKIDRLWGPMNSYYYRDLDNDTVLKQIAVPLLPGASQFKIKTRFTGHGHNSNNGEYPHCCEWKDNTHYLTVNGNELNGWHVFQYHDCGSNPVFPQGGTWPGAREGWCPGDQVKDHDFEITKYIENDEVTLDYDITPVPPENQGMGWGNYIAALQLFQYGENHFNTDVEIYEVITPSDRGYYSRMNPICTDPQVIIRNNGNDTLTTLNFTYGVSGGDPLTYQLNCKLAPHLKQEVALPVTFASFWDGDDKNVFEVKVSNPNGQVDEYGDNDVYRTHFNRPDQYDEPFILELKTNHEANRYTFKLKDIAGNVILYRNNMANDFTYSDTLDLEDGCYYLELIDAEDMGLSYWAYPEQGSGYMRILDIEGMYIKGFKSDFGHSLFYAFSMGDTQSISPVSEENNSCVYPNPFGDELTVKTLPGESLKTVRIFNMQGEEVKTVLVNEKNRSIACIDTDDLIPGLYLVKIITDKGMVVEKVAKGR